MNPEMQLRGALKIVRDYFKRRRKALLEEHRLILRRCPWERTRGEDNAARKWLKRLRPEQRAAGKFCEDYWAWLRRGRKGSRPAPVGLSAGMADVLARQCETEFNA